MTKRSDLEIQQYVAAKETMVKDQVDIVVLIADGDPFLPGFKTKAGTQFQEEGLGLPLNARRRRRLSPVASEFSQELIQIAHFGVERYRSINRLAWLANIEQDTCL